MSTTVSDLIIDTQALLGGSQKQRLNELASDPTTGTTWTFTYEPRFREGAYLACEDEIVYVWAVSNLTATVERGQFGTTNEAHATGSVVEVNPLYPKARVRRALQDDIRSWPSNVFDVETVSLSAPSTTRAINAAGFDSSNYYSVLRVLRSPVTGETSWTEVGFRAEKNMPVSSFASGVAIILDYAVGGSGATLQVSYAKPFNVDTFTDATVLADCGLKSSMLDIPPLGAAWRLVSAREANRTRTDPQGEARNAAEVPPGHILRTGESYKRDRNDRLTEEARRLAGDWPWNRWT